jgi:hypothetical protein
MTAAQFFDKQHGTTTEFLSKSEILKLMQKFSDHCFDQFKKKQENFNQQQWQHNYEERRKLSNNS